MEFLACPIGFSGGMYFADKYIFKRPNRNVWEIVGGFLFAIFGLTLFQWGLPAIGIDIFFRDPIVFGTNIAPHILFAIGAIFALIGYCSVQILESRFAKAEAATLSKADRRIHELSRTRWQILRSSGFALATLLTLMLTILLIIAFRPTSWKVEKKAARFLEQIITSINEQTNFYKEHSQFNVVSDIETHLSKISRNYKWRIFRQSENLIEYFVTFDETYEFQFDVAISKKGHILTKLFLLPPRKHKKPNLD
jgi:hypothetical protein